DHAHQDLSIARAALPPGCSVKKRRDARVAREVEIAHLDGAKDPAAFALGPGGGPFLSGCGLHCSISITVHRAIQTVLLGAAYTSTPKPSVRSPSTSGPITRQQVPSFIGVASSYGSTLVERSIAV